MNPCKKPAKPCNECPYRIDSTPGYFGENEPMIYSLAIVFDIELPCHKTMGQGSSKEHYCAGLAITRVNSFKKARYNPVIIGSEEAAKDSIWSRECFSFRHHFDRHHGVEEKKA